MAARSHARMRRDMALKMIFIIQGERVQNEGYRFFLFNLMKQQGIRGYPINLSGGVQVQVNAWGARKQLLGFYDNARLQKPFGVGKTELTGPIFYRDTTPDKLDLLSEKMDLMMENTGKFVSIGKEMNATLHSIDAKVGSGK